MLQVVVSKGRGARRVKTTDYGFFTVRHLAGYGPVVERAPAVVVVPVSREKRLWMARIQRPATGATSWELPGGALDPGERPIAAARRELLEECGLEGKRARCFRPVLEPAPGMARFPHHVVHLADVEPRARRPKGQREEGVLQVKAFGSAALRRMIAAGEVVAQPTLSALLLSAVLDALTAESR